jgi:hypothetical protein
MGNRLFTFILVSRLVVIVVICSHWVLDFVTLALWMCIGASFVFDYISIVDRNNVIHKLRVNLAAQDRIITHQQENIELRKEFMGY